MHTDRRAFTLIELLVVVAIIAVLISILLPSLSAAREQAKESVCKSGMRQLGIAFVSYSADNRDFLCSGAFDPEVAAGRDGPVDKIGWVADLVNGGYGRPGDQLCPSNPARYNQKLGPDGKTYNDAQAADLVKRGYNTNYTQAWYMARSEWNPASNDYNMRRVKATFGPLKSGRWYRLSASTIPMIGDGRTDINDIVLGQRSVKTMTDGPFGGPYGPQSYDDFGPAHGTSTMWIFGQKDHNKLRASVAFADGHVDSFTDRDHDGEFGLDNSVAPPKQMDLNESQVFDGVLSLGRRSEDAFELR
ncbi:MAG: hypothetical protein CHACPFDD_01844 [Phycisphaerae bacterium]|nr:hypothetical protein [Phycisphaerae bacterium]